MAESAGDEGGEQSLKGAKGAAFTKKMQAAAAHNSKVATPVTKGKPPKFRPLQLPTLLDAVPTGHGWFHEIKYHGYHHNNAAPGGDDRVSTRTGLPPTDQYHPPLLHHIRTT